MAGDYTRFTFAPSSDHSARAHAAGPRAARRRLERAGGAVRAARSRVETATSIGPRRRAAGRRRGLQDRRRRAGGLTIGHRPLLRRRPAGREPRRRHEGHEPVWGELAAQGPTPYVTAALPPRPAPTRRRHRPAPRLPRRVAARATAVEDPDARRARRRRRHRHAPADGLAGADPANVGAGVDLRQRLGQRLGVGEARHAAPARDSRPAPQGASRRPTRARSRPPAATAASRTGSTAWRCTTTAPRPGARDASSGRATTARSRREVRSMSDETRQLSRSACGASAVTGRCASRTATGSS